MLAHIFSTASSLVALMGLAWLAGCAPAAATPPPFEGPFGAKPLPKDPMGPDAVTSADPQHQGDTPLMLVLRQVAAARGLPIKTKVEGRRVTRAEAVAHIKDKTARELPHDVMVAQGEFLRGMGLIPADYAYVDGVYAILQDNLAGFYDQSEDAMFLLDDLSIDASRETVVHELVHALQDQHFDLGRLLDYTPGEGDRLTASHALCEGDATAATFAVLAGSPHRIGPDALLDVMLQAVGRDNLYGGPPPPKMLQRALVMPYVDGYRFVQALHRRGGWTAVDGAYARLPATTEQLLHLDKYDAREPALKVEAPPGLPGYRVYDRDVLGEQGLRLMFDQWSPAQAASAAAGWGGDRYTILGKSTPDGEVFTLAWHVRFDTEADAIEAEQALLSPRTGPFARGADRSGSLTGAGRIAGGGRCRERAAIGPFAVRRRADHLAIAAGPFLAAKTPRSAGTCAEALAWLTATLPP